MVVTGFLHSVASLCGTYKSHASASEISFTNKAAYLEETKEIVFQLVVANNMDRFCWNICKFIAQKKYS